MNNSVSAGCCAVCGRRVIYRLTPIRYIVCLANNTIYRALRGTIYSALRNVKTNTRPRNRSGVCFIYPCQIRLNAGNCVLPLFFSDLARWRLLRASSLTLSITDMSDLPGECDAHRPVSQQCWKKTRVPSIPQNCERITFKFPSTYIDNFFRKRLHIFGKFLVIFLEFIDNSTSYISY